MDTRNDPVYTQYAPAIAAAILDLFRDEGEGKEAHLFHFDLETVDATAFFTAIPVALALVYTELTEEQEDALGMTHVLNRLVAQWQIQRAQDARA